MRKKLWRTRRASAIAMAIGSTMMRNVDFCAMGYR